MNESMEPVETRCPGCDKRLEAQWVVCPYCGLRLKPADDLLRRSAAWIVVLLGFALGESAIAAKDPSLAGCLAVLIGLPLAYAFGKAVIFRVRGTPLTWNQLGRTTLRAGITTFGLLVVLPVVIGVCVIALAFIACFSGGILGGR